MRALVEGQRDRAGGHLPPRRRLHAGGEAALRDAVAVDADLLDRLAVEEGVGLLRAEEALVDLAALTEAEPKALKKVPVRVFVSKSARSAEMRLSASMNTTLPLREQAMLVSEK